VFILYSRQPPDIATVRWFSRLFRQHREAHVDGIGFIFFADPEEGNRPKLEGIARSEFIDALRGHGKAALVIFTNQGFLAAAFRALVSGLVLAIRPPGPTKVVSSLSEGLPWFVDTLGRAKLPVSSEEIEDGIDALEAATAPQ
jgi:hypothetical protein